MRQARFINSEAIEHISKVQEAIDRAIPWLEDVHDFREIAQEENKLYMNRLSGKDLLQPYHMHAIDHFKRCLKIILEASEHRYAAAAAAMRGFGRDIGGGYEIPPAYIFTDETPLQGCRFFEIALRAVDEQIGEASLKFITSWENALVMLLTSSEAEVADGE